jgi:hypothetical protein
MLNTNPQDNSADDNQVSEKAESTRCQTVSDAMPHQKSPLKSVEFINQKMLAGILNPLNRHGEKRIAGLYVASHLRPGTEARGRDEIYTTPEEKVCGNQVVERAYTLQQPWYEYGTTKVIYKVPDENLAGWMCQLIADSECTTSCPQVIHVIVADSLEPMVRESIFPGRYGRTSVHIIPESKAEWMGFGINQQMCIIAGVTCEETIVRIVPTLGSSRNILLATKDNGLRTAVQQIADSYNCTVLEPKICYDYVMFQPCLMILNSYWHAVESIAFLSTEIIDGELSNATILTLPVYLSSSCIKRLLDGNWTVLAFEEDDFVSNLLSAVAHDHFGEYQQ